MSQDGCGADVAAYALGALEPEEARAFEAHLQTCAVCAEELAGFQQTVNAVAASPTPVAAPRSLKRAVMGEVSVEAAARRPSSARSERRRRVPLGGAGLAFGGGLAFAVAAIVVAVIALPGRMGNRTVDADVTGSGTAALQITHGRGELVVRHFTAPPRGDIYEVWLKHSGGKVTPTTALFSVDRGGDASVDVPGSLYGVTHVMVTPEPAPDGSRTPTHAAVIDADLQS